MNESTLVIVELVGGDWLVDFPVAANTMHRGHTGVLRSSLFRSPPPHYYLKETKIATLMRVEGSFCATQENPKAILVPGDPFLPCLFHRKKSSFWLRNAVAELQSLSVEE